MAIVPKSAGATVAASSSADQATQGRDSGFPAVFLNEVATTMANHVQLLAQAVGAPADQAEFTRLAGVLLDSCRLLGLHADLIVSQSGHPAGPAIGDADQWFKVEASA